MSVYVEKRGEIIHSDPASLPALIEDLSAAPRITEEQEKSALANLRRGINVQEAQAIIHGRYWRLIYHCLNESRP